MSDAASTLESPRYPIESVDNVLRLLLLVKDSSSIRVGDASRRLKVAPSTAHRLLAMLRYHGFVRHDPLTRFYHPGEVLTEIGLGALQDFDIRRQARPHLEQLVDEVGETAHLTGLRGATLYFLESVETHKALRAGSRLGAHLPAHATASGKAQLSCLPRDTLEALYPSARLPAVTTRTQTSRRALFAELEQIRGRGYAVNDEESEPGLVAVAAAVLDGDGPAHGAITVAAPQMRLPSTKLAATAEIVVRTAHALAARMNPHPS